MIAFILCACAPDAYVICFCYCSVLCFTLYLSASLFILFSPSIVLCIRKNCVRQLNVSSVLWTLLLLFRTYPFSRTTKLVTYSEHLKMSKEAGNTLAGMSSETVESCRVSVRVPPFYPEKPALWFSQLEAQFALSNITTDTTKFYYATSHLEPQFASEVEDIICNPPASNKYEKLKSELTKRLSASREKKVKQLLMHEELGDRKPSQFYRHLLNLAGPGVPEEFLRTIWTSRLPSSTQTIIASQPKATLEELADLADRVHDVVGPQIASASAVAAVSQQNYNAKDPMSDQIAALTKQVAALTSKVERLSRPRGRSSNRSRNRSSGRRSQSNYRKYPLCWYHAKFGEQASKCVTPCDFKTSGNVRGNR